MNTRRIIIIVVILALAIGGYFGFRAIAQNRLEAGITEDLQTEKIAMGSLEAIVGATGTVRAKQSVLLSWQTSGTVEDVLVDLGQQVTEGEVLATLEQSSLPQNVILARADVVSAQNALESLLDGYDALAIASAEKAAADAQLRYEKAVERVDDINWTGTDAEIDKADQELQAAYNDLKAAEAKRNSIGNTSSLAYRTANLEYLQAYDVYATKLGDYNYLTGQTVDETERAITEADLALAEAQLTQAQNDLAKLKAGPDPDDVAAAEARIAAAEAALELAWIESPFAGTITQADSMPGDTVQVGVPVFRVDDLSSLLVDVDISEVDINRVAVGQPVHLTFDAILAREYNGVVVEVSPVGTLTAGLVNFRVTIELVDVDENVKPGMTAAVEVVVSQLEEVMLVPNRAVRVVDGERVVYIIKNGQLEMVNIELGASADLYSEVAGGDLRVGDEIVLNPPANSFLMGGGPGGRFGGP